MAHRAPSEEHGMFSIKPVRGSEECVQLERDIDSQAVKIKRRTDPQSPRY